MSSGSIMGRIARLRELLSRERADVFLLFVAERYNSESMTYLSGFRGSSGALVISQDRQYLVTDGLLAVL